MYNSKSNGFSFLPVLLFSIICVSLFSFTEVLADSGSLCIKDSNVTLGNGQQKLQVSISCPEFYFDKVDFTDCIKPSKIDGDISSGRIVEVSFEPIKKDAATLEVKLFLQWSKDENVLRKWVQYKIDNAKEPLICKEIVLDRLAGDGVIGFSDGANQSQPAFFEGFFAGIEFPVSTAKIENGKFRLSHQPGIIVKVGQNYLSRKAVYGFAPIGKEKQAFKKYIQSHSPLANKSLHLNYNSWYTAPIPVGEDYTVELMKQFEENMYKAHGAYFDSFCIDAGWSDVYSIWGINNKIYPDGFANVQKAAEAMNCKLGLWTSPSARYDFTLNPKWAMENGYETFTLGSNVPGKKEPDRLCALAGDKYMNAYKDNISDHIVKFGIGQLKLDGYWPTAPQDCMPDGYVGGELSKEKTAEGAIEAFEGFHKANPDAWLQSTCFGWNPSPWWLFYVESMVGCYGDDVPCGQSPCPVYRESITTGRDFYNLQGAALMPVPIAAHDLMGIVHQTDEPFLSDAVTCLMRGNKFVQFYFNPKYMDKFRWQQLADVMNWSRKNSEIITGQTQPLLPQSWRNGAVPQFSDQAAMPREPYGYAHWQEDKGLVLIRNPWITAVTYALKLDSDTELSHKFKNASIVGLYPEPRLYAKNVSYGDSIGIDLAPYETIVLSVAKGQKTANLPMVSDCIGGQIKANVILSHIINVDFTNTKDVLGDNWINRMADIKNGTKITLEAEVMLESPQNKFLLLLEGRDKSPVYAFGNFIINGKKVLPVVSPSQEGWRSSWMRDNETWTFVEVPLEKGKNTISIEAISSECSNVSAWVWASKAGGEKPDYPNSIINPEFISLDSAALIRPTDMKYINGRADMQFPVDTIDGVYLDAIKPVSVSQGYGELAINKNIADGKPLKIAKKEYLRGLCTHANSRIVYDLEGQYSRFQSWIGVDSSVSGSVIFEIYLDGKKIYNSPLIVKSDFDYQGWVDVDVKGGKKLELVVTDGGDGINADHADWAEARLIK